METILMTGGSGFIGTHLRAKMTDFRTELFGRKNAEGGVLNLEALVRASGGCRAIVHLAAAHRDEGIPREEFVRVNEGGARNVAEAARVNRIEDIFFFSSVMVYGNSGRRFHEADAVDPVTDYGASKAAAEKVLIAWASEKPERRLVILRLPVVFGPGNKGNLASLIRQIDSGLFFIVGRGLNVRSLAYVENVADSVLYLMKNCPAGAHIYNYADSPEWTSAQLIGKISAGLGKSAPFRLPLPPALALAVSFDCLSKLTGKKFSVSAARVKRLAEPMCLSSEKIRSFGFQPRFGAEEGLDAMLRWYRDTKVSGWERA